MSKQPWERFAVGEIAEDRKGHTFEILKIEKDPDLDLPQLARYTVREREGEKRTIQNFPGYLLKAWKGKS